MVEGDPVGAHGEDRDDAAEVVPQVGDHIAEHRVVHQQPVDEEEYFRHFTRAAVAGIPAVGPTAAKAACMGQRMSS